MALKYKPLKDVRFLVVHCAATPPDMDIGAKEIDLWHRREGFFSIGYHAVIRRNGLIEPGRELDRPGAHARGYNEMSLGVCLVGGCKRGEGGALIPENNFTPEQFEALRGILRTWKFLHPPAEIKGHNELDSYHARLKACPSFSVKEWLRDNPIVDIEEVTVTAPRLS